MGLPSTWCVQVETFCGWVRAAGNLGVRLTGAISGVPTAGNNNNQALLLLVATRTGGPTRPDATSSRTGPFGRSDRHWTRLPGRSSRLGMFSLLLSKVAHHLRLWWERRRWRWCQCRFGIPLGGMPRWRFAWSVGVTFCSLPRCSVMGTSSVALRSQASLPARLALRPPSPPDGSRADRRV